MIYSIKLTVAVLTLLLFTTDAKWHGCYDDYCDHDLDGAYQDFPTNNSQAVCNQFCLDKGFAYYGLQDGTKCFCGDSYGKYGRIFDYICSANCPMSNISNFHCGGRRANQIFDTEKPSEVKPISGVASVTYEGCYVDEKYARDMNGSRIRFKFDNSPEKCGNHCRERGFLYFGLSNSRICYCGNSYGRYGTAPETECDWPCTDPDTEAMCGGKFRNSVYKFDL